MAIITISITESENQSISGIPNFLILATNIPATIFYTLDGSNPDTSSLVYTGGELALPLNRPSVNFKVFATNGTDSSAVIERNFKPQIDNPRQSKAIFTAETSKKASGFPYGKGFSNKPFDRSGTDGITVNSAEVPNIFDGYDGTATGTVTGGTDLDLSEYLIKYSESNRANTEKGRGIGTLPAQVDVVKPNPPPSSSDRNEKLFNPRALVIFQDSRFPPSDPNVVNINRQFFDLGNPEKNRDGILFNTTGFEGNAVSGSLVRTQFNPRNNTLTYYYFDSHALRWVISTEPYSPKSPRISGLQKILFSQRREGDSKVFRWIPFKGSRLI